MPTDLIDRGIAIVIVFFLLSMISERFVTWVKLYFGQKGKYLIGFSLITEDDTKRKKNPIEEKARERRILGLNVILSIAISFLAKADFFNILSNSTPYESLGWQNINLLKHNIGDDFDKYFIAIIGCCLTGLFISLGSKFWHDTLDLLFFTKNIKEKLSNPQTYQVTSTAELDEFISLSEQDLVKLSIIQNEQLLKAKFPNIRFLSDTIVTKDAQDRWVIGIYCIDDKTGQFPSKLPARLPSGKLYESEVEIFTSTGKARISLGLNHHLANEKYRRHPGSACCIVKDNQNHYLLTNCHVLTGGLNSNPLFDTRKVKVLYDETKVGTWHYGSISHVGDFALVRLNNLREFRNEFRPILFNNNCKTNFNQNDLKKQVTCLGAKTSKGSKAYIVDILIDKLEVEYSNNIQKFKIAIVLGDTIEMSRSNPPTQFGDSGGLVYDSQNTLIGIITSRDDRFTYAIPVADFLKSFNLQIL
jgi:hypothetical protein